MLHRGPRLLPSSVARRTPAAHQPPCIHAIRPALHAPRKAARAAAVADSAFPMDLHADVLTSGLELINGSQDATDHHSISTDSTSSHLRMTAESEVDSDSDAAMVTCRIVVPYHPTRPGQQLFLSGGTRELGGWDAARAVPLEWRPGHQHEALVRLPTSRVVQARLVLKEDGVPVHTEQGDPRDIVLLPVAITSFEDDHTSSASSSDGGGAAFRRPQQRRRQQQHQDATSSLSSSSLTTMSTSSPSSTPGQVQLAAAVPTPDYLITCHFDVPEATQVLRTPIVLPARQPGDRRVLAKFVVLLAGQRLEPRQVPVLVGSAEELGGWRPEAGVRLMRQVGGYWTRRVELPLEAEVEAKVVICNPDGQAVLWEPGTANRVLTAPPPAPAPVPQPSHHTKGAAKIISSTISSGSSSNGGANTASSASQRSNGNGAGVTAASPQQQQQQQQDMMYIFVCRWGATGAGCTAVVTVPVEYEDASQEVVRQLDAAQREIGLMRQAVTAKSRRCQSLETELAASRRAERGLREEVAALRGGMGELVQELEAAQAGELAARQEVEELGWELGRQREEFEQQISWLEAKLDEMEQQLTALQQQQQQQQRGGRTTVDSSNDNDGSSGYFMSYEHDPPRVITRSNWR